MSSYISNITIA